MDADRPRRVLRQKTPEELARPVVINGPLGGWGPCWSDTMYGKEPNKKRKEKPTRPATANGNAQIPTGEAVGSKGGNAHD